MSHSFCSLSHNIHHGRPNGGSSEKLAQVGSEPKTTKLDLGTLTN